MGIYDRDYYRQRRPSFSIPGPRTMVGLLILTNVVLYLADALVANGGIADLLAAHVGALTRPWLWWQFLTYGFAHSMDPEHVIFNMLGLFFLGRDVESVYGPKEFLRIYLTLIVFGGVVWAVIGHFTGAPDFASVIGASGAVAGIVVLYALHFPRRMLLLFFVLPVPAWFAGVLLVGMDAYGAIVRPHGSNIAYTVHLAGAALAFVYFRQRWNFGRLGMGRFSFRPWRPRLRLHEPDAEPDQRQRELHQEVDRILEKISREGEASLTRKERKTLESASRQYQKQRHEQDNSNR
jgi:membrane associated rhomboid family serine protease